MRVDGWEVRLRASPLCLAMTLAWSVAALADAPQAVPNVSIIAPAPADMAATYPDAARGKNLDGEVSLSCKIRTDDGLDCGLRMWRPSGYGFEAAALAIAARLRVKSNDNKTYAGQTFSITMKFPPDTQDAPSPPTISPPLPAPPPMRAVLKPSVPASGAAAVNLPYLEPVNGKAFDIDKGSEPWVVTFHLIDVARLRTCNDKDPVITRKQIDPGTTMPVGQGQRIELYVSFLQTWSVVSEANRCAAPPK